MVKSLRQKENDVLSELAQRYRDRAKERRDGANPDYVISEDGMTGSMGSGANVAPDHKSRTDFAERRKQLIEESKFLGGDMEHTHLVKGLDYALLHKVKAELQLTEREEEDDEENGEESVVDDGLPEIDRIGADDGSDEFDIKSRMALSIVSLLNQKGLQRNELFLPSRMAYLVDLENEAADDIPITVIRSKSECPSLDAVSHSTNDIVINKLAVIIASHRSGVGRKEREAASSSSSGKSEILRKKVKYEDGEDVNSESSRKIASRGDSQTCKPNCKSDTGLSIYDDLDDDYEPVRSRKKSAP